MPSVVSVLEALPPLLVLLVAFVLIVGETAVLAGLFFPAEQTLLFVGLMVYIDVVALAPAILLMIAAALLGDSLAFRAGRRHGPRVRASRLGDRVGDRRWARADRMLHRLGGRGIVAARWLPFVRTLLPRLAGGAGMPYRRFVAWNALGVVTAVGESVLLGYLAGASFDRVAAILGRATTAVLILLAAIMAIVLVGRWLGRHPDPVTTLAARAARLPPLRWAAQRYGALFRRLSARIGAGWTWLLNLVAGLALLFALGFGLSWLVQFVVNHSGMSRVDAMIAGWFADHHTQQVAEVARTVAAVLRGSVLIVVVAVVALVLGARSRAWRGGLVGLVGTAGAFLPLLVLAIVADLTGGGAGGEPTPVGVFSTQSTVVTAGLCTLAWLLTRRAGWRRAVAGWTAAGIGILLAAGSRLYLGWHTASDTATAVLLGALWAAVFMIAWRTRSHPPTQVDHGVLWACRPACRPKSP